MGLLDRLFGRGRRQAGYDDRANDGRRYGDDRGQGYGDDRYDGRYGPGSGYDDRSPAVGGQLSDRQAAERYRYLLRTAPPDQIEEAHAEAFAQLTPEQRQEVLVQLAAAAPSSERPRTDDARSLARAATRAEMRRPGTLERIFGPGGGSGGYGGPGYGGPGYGGPGYGRGYGGGFGMGGFGASMLGTIGGLVVGTAVADALFDTGLGDGGLFGGGDEEAYAEGYQDGAGADGGDYGDGGGGDFGGGFDGGGYDGEGGFGGGDFGGDF